MNFLAVLSLTGVTYLTELFLFPLVVASFSWFYKFCMLPSNILEGWGKLLSKLPAYIQKPLGQCVYCFATWTCVAFTILLGLNFMELFVLVSLTFLYNLIIDKYLADVVF